MKTPRKHVALQHRGFVPGVNGGNATRAIDPSTALFQSIGPLGEDGVKDWTVGSGVAYPDGTPGVYEFDIVQGHEGIKILLGSCEINGKVYRRDEELVVKGPNTVRMVFTGTLACAYLCIFER